MKFLTTSAAAAVLSSNGFALGAVSSYIDVIGRQTPGAGAAAVPGGRGTVPLGTMPSTPCP